MGCQPKGEAVADGRVALSVDPAPTVSRSLTHCQSSRPSFRTTQPAARRLRSRCQAVDNGCLTLQTALADDRVRQSAAHGRTARRIPTWCRTTRTRCDSQRSDFQATASSREGVRVQSRASRARAGNTHHATRQSGRHDLGLSMALQEHSVLDPRFGRVVNHDFAATTSPPTPTSDRSRCTPWTRKTATRTRWVPRHRRAWNRRYRGGDRHHATGIRVRGPPITLDRLL
jgi:hypothetical protein